ncbi:ABC transporter ATP-binding protein [Streptomyces sp. NPDC005529]|uniref:ABC transporter ATP-binding protein n=1 Tax=unclassified Streptomyces TaxID=2593676 RepID=UPI0033A33126
MSAGLLVVENLNGGYGDLLVLHHVALVLAPGSVTAVLGANGAGKTTLLRTLSGLMSPVSGRVTLGDEDITHMPPEQRVRRGMAHVPEGRGVIGELTVEENLRMGGLWRHGKDPLRKSLDEAYDVFPALSKRRHLLGSQLSGGEQQMLSLGRALMGRPRLLLLDEPSLGLAPHVVTQFMELLRLLCERTDLTVLLAEQNVRRALAVADRGVVISLGRVVADEQADVLRADDTFRHRFLGF